MKIYTKTGDRGETALFGGARVSKASSRVSAYGEVDELNSVLGVARAHAEGESLSHLPLHELQGQLFSLGAELAKNPDKDVDLGVPLIGSSEIEGLEALIDALEAELPALKTFILPGGTKAASFLHLSRTICRRAERAVIALRASEPVRDEVVIYLNRLSDLLFVMARYANHRAGVDDIPWVGRKAQERA